MEAITEVTTVENGQVTVKIPSTFSAKRVRVMVWAEEKPAMGNAHTLRLSDLRGSLPDLDLAAWDKHIEDIRNEWDR